MRSNPVTLAAVRAAGMVRLPVPHAAFEHACPARKVTSPTNPPLRREIPRRCDRNLRHSRSAATLDSRITRQIGAVEIGRTSTLPTCVSAVESCSIVGGVVGAHGRGLYRFGVTPVACSRSAATRVNRSMTDRPRCIDRASRQGVERSDPCFERTRGGAATHRSVVRRTAGVKLNGAHFYLVHAGAPWSVVAEAIVRHSPAHPSRTSSTSSRTTSC